MSLVIQTSALARSYRTYQKEPGLVGSLKGFWNRKYTETIAVAPTTISINSGQIVGLVGANGAGKTTLLKMLSGLVQPSSGSAEVLGFTPWKRDNRYLRQMSILLGQKNQLWWDISPFDSFNLLAEIYDLEPKHAQSRVQELAELLDCTHVLKTQLRRLSLGERMKMEIIGALLHSPRILFLDEPTIGLDIIAQTTIRKFIGDYVREKGTTVILTSHYMDDIALLADRLLLVSKGNMVYDGSVDEFTQKTELKQKISFSLLEPIGTPLKLQAFEFPAQTQEFLIQVTSADLPSTLNQVTQLKGIHNLKIEEADFEDTIRAFLEKESRVLSPGRRQQP